MKNIIITGIMGVGKTTIGRALAEELNYQFIDLDKTIEIHCGVDVATIFAIEGESGFRTREEIELRRVLNRDDNYVLSLGGGCAISENNRQLIKNSKSVVIELVADLDSIVKRLAKSPNKRPLVAGGDIRVVISELYKNRKIYYDAISDFTFKTDDFSVASLVNQLVAKVQPYL